jgi:hypothetical protein
MATRPNNDSTSQIKRFREASRELGTNESEVAFDRVLRKVAKAPPAPMHKPIKQKRSAKPKRT